ncbi:alpha/beta fold hydrolase [Myceligenerans pegani]|uniref:Alpha/beta fold hydrolase n=1 Tax=Myceligenerans pegani TaxID=2776917 RepID=A0ABR9N0F8_9MICO|nr:alpha/beta hydrolase [Myceligenerans sp. TRM 65318]MBE1876835.1 alpha/beta fold hydrolase [Myceligenerans sp. TRM 65318]MBE3019106.1 alpha/beta fold hydrolase [Myceligenerans sp. TRM 65318]
MVERNEKRDGEQAGKRAPGRPVPRWRRIGTRVVLTMSLLVNVVLLATPSGPAVGAWRSAEGRAEYVTAYDEVMTTLPEPARTHDVDTDYGTVRAYLFAGPGVAAPGGGASDVAPGGGGPDSASGGGESDVEPGGGAADPAPDDAARDDAVPTPVVLLPGWGSGAPMWQTNLPDLMAERPVYALDALGDAGMSTQSVPLDSPAAQADWVDQTLAGLGVDRAHVVGHSFGGWSAMNYAVHHPGRVASLSLLDPVQTFGSFSWQIVVRSIPSAIPFLPQSWRDAALADIGGVAEIDPDDPMTRMIAAGTEHYASQRSTPSTFTAEQLRTLPVPVYAALAGDGEVNGDPEAAVRFANEHLRESDVRLWPGATHSLPFEQAEAVDEELLAFMADHDD